MATAYLIFVIFFTLPTLKTWKFCAKICSNWQENCFRTKQHICQICEKFYALASNGGCDKYVLWATASSA